MRAWIEGRHGSSMDRVRISHGCGSGVDRVWIEGQTFLLNCRNAQANDSTSSERMRTQATNLVLPLLSMVLNTPSFRSYELVLKVLSYTTARFALQRMEESSAECTGQKALLRRPHSSVLMPCQNASRCSNSQKPVASNNRSAGSILVKFRTCLGSLEE